MNLKSLRYFFTLGLLTVAGYSWATPSLPQNDNPTWQDIANIQWSTNNGGTWGNSALAVGQSVEFKITMHKYEDGNHYGDLLKVWIDYNGDQQFQNSETLLFGTHVVNPIEKPWRPDSVVNQSFVFTSGPVNLTNSMVGDHFLLARVTCTDSLLTTAKETGKIASYTWNDQWNSTYTSGNNAMYGTLFSAAAHYGQGESELVKLTVNSVPEPGTLALFSVAMLGMGWIRKKTTRV